MNPPDTRPLPRTASPGRWRLSDTVKALLLVLVAGLLLYRGTERLGYLWQWYRVPPFLVSLQDGTWRLGPLLDGLLVTLYITALSLILSLLFGLVSALFRLSDSIVARGMGRVYVEAVRNTPLLVQIFFVYFVAGPVLGMERLFSAVLALSLFEGAYASEIIRAGILSVPKGQWEAADSLGMGRFDTYRTVILPQAVRHMLPPLTGQAVSLVKDSALVSAIAVYDLAMQAQAIIAETYLTFEVWFTVAAIYLVMTVTLSVVASFLERRLSTGVR